MVTLMMNRVNTLNAYIKIFFFFTKIILSYQRKRLSTNLAFNYSHTLLFFATLFAQAKLKLLFGQFLVDGWGSLVVLDFSRRSLSDQFLRVTEELTVLRVWL